MIDSIVKNSIKTSLINSELQSHEKYQHQLITNKNIKLISELKYLLSTCDEFLFSIAFITLGGVSSIINELLECEKRNIVGKIITGDYQNFTQPEALNKLDFFANINLKMCINENLHAKGYYFRHGDIWTIIIGSSNLTQNALTINNELNIKFSSYKDGDVVKQIFKNFDETFERSYFVKDIIGQYQEKYELSKGVYNKVGTKLNIGIEPNSMQKKALKNLQLAREKDISKGLLISATGTGKTFVSAFDVKQMNPKKMLFIVHRENIAKKAMESFQKIMPNKSYGLYTGGKYNLDADYIFATIQTISRSEQLQKFDKNMFEYIIIDEVHHIGADSYRKVIDHFEPCFLLGMTATPERTDGFNIYELFDYNIVHEIRLNDALEAEILTPFMYYGVADVSVDGNLLDEKADFNQLISESRIQHIIEQSQFYGYSGDVLHSLLFVSRIDEGKELERLFLKRDIKAKFLSGENTESERQKYIDQFEDGIINYLITVDIFNEGIDIPCVNQVILLRPTSSAIVYVQQIGRGLRKYNNKEYVVIIDFIGNYEKNFLVPVALSQNFTGQKDGLLKFLNNPNEVIYGNSIITFDKIVKEKIIEQVSTKKLATKGSIKKEYEILYNRLNRVPLLNDFYQHHLTAPSVIIENYGTIKKFYNVMNVDIEFKNENGIDFLYKYFLTPSRIHEIFILNSLNRGMKTIDDLSKELEVEYGLTDQEEVLKNALSHLMRTICVTFSQLRKYQPLVVESNGFYKLVNIDKVYLEDVIKCGIKYAQDNDLITNDMYIKTHIYNKRQCAVNSLLDYNEGKQIAGHFWDEEAKTMLIFMNFDNENSFTNYDNYLLNDCTFVWYSQKNRVLERNGQPTVEGRIAQGFYKIHAFGRRSKNSFYYLGDVEEIIKVEEIKIEDKKVVKYTFKLDSPIDEAVYSYLNQMEVIDN